MLTQEQLHKLKEPFPPNAHEFLKGLVYLAEEWVTARIEQVDPSWEFHIDEVGLRGDQVYTRARLTICGVSRSNIGEQSITVSKETSKEFGEPEKGSATDALKRCARLFGIGRYLLNAPNEQAFPAWLEATHTRWSGSNNGQAPKLAPKPERPSVTPAADDNAKSKADTEFESIAGTDDTDDKTGEIFKALVARVTLDAKAKQLIVVTFGDEQAYKTPTTKAFVDAGYAVKQWKDGAINKFAAAAMPKIEYTKTGKDTIEIIRVLTPEQLKSEMEVLGDIPY
jgi:hypothetical protein